ncbi:ATP-binding protein [Segetibacter koreensis]|uniref:ATP-binding protein n=1 Tax=Segetibacter koreensis TaxID=398037 RepID=UPI000378674D|nr:ATP-binding protein [Segetibacter koreensis]
MKIKDIVNRGVAKINTCESEPIHIPGSIQPHGFLLGVNKKTNTIEFCSANSELLFDEVPADLLGHSLSSVLQKEWFELESYLLSPNSAFKPFSLKIRGGSYDIISHTVNHLRIIEFEASNNDRQEDSELFEQTREFVLLIERARSLQQLCQNIADETRKITGYDRVMIYRFDREYNGEVYAESKREGLEPFFGLHYPHTDIPAQARALYMRQQLRIIANVDYKPVPLLTIDEGTEKTLDLSDVGLRSVSPIHIQYLKNMGVMATLTISLIQDGKLWGLIACHHMQAKTISFVIRQRALLQAHFLSSQIKVRQVAEEHEVNIQVEAHLQQLLSKINAEEDFSLKFEQFSSLLAVCGASGVIILHRGEFFEKGLVPSREEITKLLGWIDNNITGINFATSALHTRYPGAEDISQYASGIVYHSLGRPKEDCIIWFREEVEKTINWAGNPNKAVQRDGISNMLTPRTSFALWKERVRNQSKEWCIAEVNAASRFATALQNHFHLLHLKSEDFRLRILNDKLQKANQELSNINWITSHDLKEPLRKIQIFSSRIAGTKDQSISEEIKQSVDRIQKSTKRMTDLVNDILTYSLTEGRKSDFTKSDLNVILEEVLKSFEEEILENGAIISASLLPQNVDVIPHQIQQLFTNLIGNALKFSSPDRKLHLSITCNKTKGIDVVDAVLLPRVSYYKIAVVDNGIGFDPRLHQLLFNIFYRGHNDPQFKGTGIGLAISKKIMENHKGAITAQRNNDQGATFTLYLPYN